MKKIQGKDIWLLAAQLLLLSLIMLSPGLISYISSKDGELAVRSIWISLNWLGPMVVVYLLNFYFFIPQMWYRRRFWQFSVANVVLIVLCNLHLISNDISNLPKDGQRKCSRETLRTSRN